MAEAGRLDRGATGREPGEAWRALVCVTTCLRPDWLRRTLPHFARICEADPRLHFLVALDGDDAETRELCATWDVPLVWSDAREGVGISRNRVLERFGDFDHYFFLDDDAEPVHGWPFPLFVRIAAETGIHHLSGSARRETGVTRLGDLDVDGVALEDVTVRHGLVGGGQFIYCTGEGLRRVGGWHPAFAEYRRWGHTEHSWRFPRNGLAPAPFNAVEELSRAFVWHSPPRVTRVEGVELDDDEIAAPEREIMALELEHVPVTTLAPHHFNGVPFGRLARLAATLGGGGRYPLLEGRARRRARADFALWRGMRYGAGVRRLGWLLRSAALWPGNPMLRHRVKEMLGRVG